MIEHQWEVQGPNFLIGFVRCIANSVTVKQKILEKSKEIHKIKMANKTYTKLGILNKIQ